MVWKPTEVKMLDDEPPDKRASFELSNDFQDALSLGILDERSLALLFIFDESNRDILREHRTILPLARR